MKDGRSRSWLIRVGLGVFTCSLLVLTACGGGGGDGGTTNPPANTAPSANAGPDQTVAAGATVTLSGSGTDTGGSIASYAWTQTAGTTVVLSSATAATPTFTAPNSTSASTLTFSLTVTDNGGLTSTTDTVTINVQAGISVSVSGTVTFARVPFNTLTSGLSYANTRQDPARAITVEAIDSSTQAVLASTTTDASGSYTLLVPGNINMAIRAKAEMVRAAPLALPRWNFTVRDAGGNGTTYTYAGTSFNSGTAAATQNLDIPSGWNSLTRMATGTRDSAPFAILDTVYKGYNLILSAAPNTDFPVLTLDWATSNPGGETFYDNAAGADSRNIVLSGEANVDTDEFDEHVIAHEFGHYIEDRFSRSDSIGGAHGPGDRLDLRVAFGEGFGYAFASIVLNDPVPRDSFGNLQNQDSSFSVETDSGLNEGWYSEASVQEVLWDLFDNAQDAGDNVSLGFGPIWQVLTGDEKTTPAITSIFPFITAIKVQNSSASADVDTRVAAENIAPIDDAFATGETNDAGNADLLPVYKPISIGGGAVVVRSSAAFGAENKLGNHQFLKLDVGVTQTVRVIVTGPPGRDVDLYVLKNGAVVTAGELNGDEDFNVTLTAGTYVLDTYDCENAGCGPNPGSPSTATVDISVTVQ